MPINFIFIYSISLVLVFLSVTHSGSTQQNQLGISVDKLSDEVLSSIYFSNSRDGISRVKRATYRKRPIASTPPSPVSDKSFKCDFVGAIGIKGQCNRYLQCSRIGVSPTPTLCPSGKNFDHVKRTCISRYKAKCSSEEVCPKNGKKYSDENNKSWYLVCKDGVPHPTKCKDGDKFDENKLDCGKE